MPDPIVYERPDSRRGSTPYGLSTGAGSRWWSREYIAKGYPSEVDARNAVAAYLGANSLSEIDGCPLKSISLDEDHADGDWRFKALWELSAAISPSTDDDDVEPPYEYSFDIGASTFRRTRSLETIKKGSREDEVAPDFQQAIGVTKDGVEGVECDDDEGTEEFSVDLDKSLVTPAFRRSLRLIRGKTNAEEFIGHQPGEARFDGVRGSLKSDGRRVRLTFKFTWRPDQVVRGYPEFFYAEEEDGGFVKAGWDYLWEYAEKIVLETTSGPIDEPVTLKYPGQRTVGVYIERIYERASFALLQAILDGAGSGTYTPPTPPGP